MNIRTQVSWSTYWNIDMRKYSVQKPRENASNYTNKTSNFLSHDIPILSPIPQTHTHTHAFYFMGLQIKWCSMLFVRESVKRLSKNLCSISGKKLVEQTWSRICFTQQNSNTKTDVHLNICLLYAIIQYLAERSWNLKFDFNCVQLRFV